MFFWKQESSRLFGMDSDSDFENSGSGRGRASLRFAINCARRYIKRARGEGRLGGVAGELAEAFPCHRPSGRSRGHKKRKIQQWRFIPVCLQSPLTSTVPTKGVLDTQTRSWFQVVFGRGQAGSRHGCLLGGVSFCYCVPFSPSERYSLRDM